MNEDLDSLIENELLDIDDCDFFNDGFEYGDDLLSIKLSLLEHSKHAHVVESVSENNLQFDSDNLLEHIFQNEIGEINAFSYSVIRSDTYTAPSIIGCRIIDDVILKQIPTRILYKTHLEYPDAAIIENIINEIVSCLESDPFIEPYQQILIPRKDISDSTDDSKMTIIPRLYEEDDNELNNTAFNGVDESLLSFSILGTFDQVYSVNEANINVSASLDIENTMHFELNTLNVEENIVVNHIDNESVDKGFNHGVLLDSNACSIIIPADELISQRVLVMQQRIEKLRTENKAIRIQRWYRRQKIARQFRLRRLKIKTSAAITIQCFHKRFRIRISIARRKIRKQNTVLIQSQYRRYMCRNRYQVLLFQEKQRLENLRMLEQQRKLQVLERQQINNELRLMEFEEGESIAFNVEDNAEKDETLSASFPNIATAEIVSTYERKLLSKEEILNIIESLKVTWQNTITMSMKIMKPVIKSVIDTKCVKPDAPLTHMELSLKNWQQNCKFENINKVTDVKNSNIQINSSIVIPLADKELIQDLGLNVDDSLAIYTLELTVESLNSLTFLQRFRNLAKLNINVNKVKSLQGIETLINLTHLSISDNKLESLAGLEQLRMLKSLSIDRNRIQDLSPLSSLQLVTLSAVSNLIESIPSGLKLLSLQTLNLEHNKLVEITQLSFSNMPLLTFLSLEHNLLETISATAFDGSNCPLLQTIIFSHNNLTNLPIISQPLLRNLWITGNKITNFSAWVRTDISPIFMPMLEKLYLQDNSVNTICENVFDMIPNLIEMNLSFNRISNSSQLTGLRQCSSLKSIYLHDNPFSSARTIMHHIYNREMDWKLIVLSLCPSLRIISDCDVDINMRKSFDECKISVSRTHVDYCSMRYCSYMKQIKTYKISRSPHPEFNSLFLHFVDDLISKQNIFKSEEMIDKRQSKSSSSNNSKALNTKQQNLDLILLEKINDEFWENEYIDLLIQQIQLIKSFNHLSYIPISNNEKQYILKKNSWLVGNVDQLLEKYKSLFIKLVDQKLINSCKRIQSLWRGYKIRKRIKAAILSIKYVDKSLDELFQENDMSMLDDISILTSADVDFDFTPSFGKHSNSSSALVYGDHRRPSKTTPTNAVKAISGWNSNDASRPSTSHSNATSMSAISSVSTHGQQRTLDYDNVDEVSFINIHSNLQSSLHAAENRRPKEIYVSKDPNKPQISTINHGKERNHKHLKNTINKGTAHAEAYGSFGGRPKPARTIRNHGNRKIPAWAMSEDENKD